MNKNVNIYIYKKQDICFLTRNKCLAFLYYSYIDILYIILSNKSVKYIKYDKIL